MSITVVGSLNLDLVTNVPRLPRPGETVMGTGMQRRPGGKGANQAVACARAGGRVRMVGTCGTDETAETLIHALADEGVDTARVLAVEEQPTGTAMIMVDSLGENLIALSPGANACMTTEMADQACADLTGEDIVLLQLELPLAVVEHTARAAKERSATTILNAAPAVDGVVDVLPHLDVLVVNEHELLRVSRECGSDENTVEAQARHLADRAQCLIVTTLGPEGALMTNRNTSIHFAAPIVDVVDSTGAGDTFTGYLAAGMSRGVGTVEAIRTAIAAASIMTTRHGTQIAIPFLQDIGSVGKGA